MAQGPDQVAFSAAAVDVEGRQHRAAGACLSALLRAAHIGPGLAVTVLTALLAVAADQPAATVVLVTAAVFTGQLTIGWGNDLRDAGRDRQVGRRDKPLATGGLSPRLVWLCLTAAAAACVVLSLLLGPWSAGLHLLVCLGSAHAYNLGLKATAWSWAPYAVAFGALPAVVSLAETSASSTPASPAPWLLLAAAALGVAAHFLNALPDLDDDLATGVSGLPHRLGAGRARVAAVALLLAGSVLAVLGPAGRPPAWSAVALGLTGVLAVVAWAGSGKTPFRAAVAIALVDVVLLVTTS